MFTTAHVSIAIILGRLSSAYVTSPRLLLFLIFGSVIPDIDIIYSRCHRFLITHNPILYLSILPFGIFVPELLFAAVGALLHLFIDSFDWGINVKPLTKKVVGLGLLGKKFIGFRESLKTYFSSRIFVVLEIVILILAVVVSI